MKHKDLTEKIISCAFRVYNKMSYGFLESVYEKCMLIELHKNGLKADNQVPISVYYEDKIVGDFIADIIVNNTIILELKSIKHTHQAHEVQLVNYLTATGKEVGLLLNFSENQVEVKRKVKTLNQG